MWLPAPSICKWSKIINFVLSEKLWVKMHVLQDPIKAYIFYPDRFLNVLPKKTRNKHLLATHGYYLLFKTFFFQMNNKDFFWWSIPLILMRAINSYNMNCKNSWECFFKEEGDNEGHCLCRRLVSNSLNNVRQTTSSIFLTFLFRNIKLMSQFIH